MRKSKKILIPIIIILVLLLMAGAAFAYIYMETDMLKTDRQLFFKYFNQITAEDEFVDKKIEQYNQKKNESPYKNSGEMTVNVEYPEDTMQDILDKMNDLSITYSGVVDPTNQMVEENVEIDYGNNVVFPITYRQINDNYGIKIEKVSKKFIAIRNENIDELITNIIGDDTFGTTEGKISEIKENFEQLIQKFELSEEEKKQLEEIYSPILEEQLIDQSFSSVKTEQNNSYILHLSSEQLRGIIIKILETTKEKPFIINKINDVILEYDADAEMIEINQIDELIESINEENIDNIPNLKITLVQANEELKQIVIESGDNKVSITKNKTEDEISYRIDSNVIEEPNLLDENQEEVQANFYLNMKFKGLQEMNLVQENYEIGFGTNSADETLKYDYIINTSTEFKESVSVEELDKDSALFLNDYTGEKIRSFLEQVGTRLSTINKNQMEELGLEEDENPLLYSNPVTMIIVGSMKIFDSANDVIENQGSDISNNKVVENEVSNISDNEM